jgi:hypothetical protein
MSDARKLRLSRRVLVDLTRDEVVRVAGGTGDSCGPDNCETQIGCPTQIECTQVCTGSTCECTSESC